MSQPNINKIPIPHQKQKQSESSGKQAQDQAEINQLNDAYLSMLKDEQYQTNPQQIAQNNYPQLKVPSQNISLPNNEHISQQNRQFPKPYPYIDNPYAQGGREHWGGHRRGWGRGHHHHSHWQPPPPYVGKFEQQSQKSQFKPAVNPYGGYGGDLGGYRQPSQQYQYNSYESFRCRGWGGKHQGRWHGDKGQWKGKCGGWGGWGERQQGRRHRRGRSRSRSSSRSSSSSSESSKVNTNSNQVNQFQQKFQQFQANLRAYYQKEMTGYFEQRKINEIQRQKIIKRLLRKFPQGNFQPQQLIQALQIAEQFNLVQFMKYFRIIKEILKFDYDMNEAVPRLFRIQQKKIRKFQADKSYKQKYGDKEIVAPLDIDQLINLDLSQTLFLVDGNNIFDSNKHFRRYFQSFLLSQKIQGQLRLQWMISHALAPEAAILFFDQKYDEDTFSMTRHYIIPDQDLNRLKGVQVVYGQTTKADDRIVDRLKQLKQQNIAKKIVLVSADRELYVKCREVANIDHSSGKFFIKFLKHRIFRQYKGIKGKNNLAKTIMKYKNR